MTYSSLEQFGKPANLLRQDRLSQSATVSAGELHFRPVGIAALQLWEQSGNGTTPPNVQKKARPFNRLRKTFFPEPESLSDKTPSEESTFYDNICEDLVTYCLLDLTEQTIKVCSAEQKIDMVRELPKKAGQTSCQHLRSVILKNAAEDTVFLGATNFLMWWSTGSYFLPAYSVAIRSPVR